MLAKPSSARPTRPGRRTQSTLPPSLPVPVATTAPPLGQIRARPSWSKAWVKALSKLEVMLPSKDGNTGRDPEDELERMRQDLHAHIEHMEQDGLDEDPAHLVNGLRTFGVSKGLVTRAVVAFHAPPSPHPLTVCFHYPTPFLNHSYVRHMVLARIHHLPGARIVSIQYQDRNVFHGTKGIENRWIVKVSTKEAFDTLQTQGVVICHRVRPVSSYDDVLRAEFREYRQYLEHQKALMVDHFKGLSGSDDYLKNVVREVTDQVLPDLEEGP